MQRNMLKALGHIAQKHLETDKEGQKGHHDEGLKSKEFNAEDQVLFYCLVKKANYRPSGRVPTQ